MKESSKTNVLRGRGFIERYLRGRVVDIGAGDDPVTPDAEAFDQAQGDANRILEYLERGVYDAVHSSHCLEHMENPTECLLQWWELLKPGGHLVLVVPDEDLYEQGFWPSRFNGDHKATFRLRRLSGAQSWSPVSYCVEDLLEALPDARIVSIELQDEGYDRSLQCTYPPRTIRPKGLLVKISRSLIRRIPVVGVRLARRIDRRLLVTNGLPIDQTRWGALAQIQAVVRKH